MTECIKSSTLVCRLLLQTFVKEWVVLRSSVTSSVMCDRLPPVHREHHGMGFSWP
ncbi:unnamed protein product, partial [Staurois parvus]